MGKTIAQELFAIAEAQGGTASGYPHTIAGAVDALTDALAGSDVDSGRTIAEAVAVMGEYIGGGGGSTNTLYMRYSDMGDEKPFDGCVCVNQEDEPRTDFGTATIEGDDYSTLTVGSGDMVAFMAAPDAQDTLVDSNGLLADYNGVYMVPSSAASEGNDLIVNLAAE